VLAPPVHHDVRDVLSILGQRLVHNALEGHVLSLSVGQVGAEQRLGARHLDSITESARPEAGEDRDVDGADPDAGEHEDDRLAARRHVDAEAVSLPDAQPAQRGSGPANLVLQLRVGEHGALAPLVLAHQCGTSSVASIDVAVNAIPGEVGLAAHKPSEVAPAIIGLVHIPLEHAIPRSVPG
jgi:hypothetical protein